MADSLFVVAFGVKAPAGATRRLVLMLRFDGVGGSGFAVAASRHYLRILAARMQTGG